MIGVPGTAQRLFGALREHGISVVLISQASSEHSICFAIPQAEAERTAAVVRQTFSSELEQGQLQNVDVATRLQHPVGGRRRHGGHARRRGEGVLGARQRRRQRPRDRAGLVRAQHLDGDRRAPGEQGARLGPFRLLSVAAHGVDRPDRSRARWAARCSSRSASQIARLARDFRLDLRLRGDHVVEDGCCSPTQPIPLDGWQEALQRRRPPDLGAIRGARERRSPAARGDHRLLGERRGGRALSAMARRRAFTSSRRTSRRTAARSSLYAKLAETRGAAAGSHYLYEATVGAGLPIIQTLRDLRETGDEIRRIEGILSGTLAYLFNVWDGSAAVFGDRARRQGQRLHRARSARRPVGHGRGAQADHPRRARWACRSSLRTSQLEGLVPAERWRAARAEEFMDRLPELDASMLRRLEAARAQGRVLRYVASLDAATQRATVGLVELDRIASVRQHQPHRQHRPVHHRPLRPQSARRAGPRRRSERHGGRRVRRSAARLRVSRGEPVTWPETAVTAMSEPATPRSDRVRAGQRRQRGRRVRRARPQRRRRSATPSGARRISERARPHRRHQRRRQGPAARGRAQHRRRWRSRRWSRRSVSTMASS